MIWQLVLSYHVLAVGPTKLLTIFKHHPSSRIWDAETYILIARRIAHGSCLGHTVRELEVSSSLLVPSHPTFEDPGDLINCTHS